MPEPSQKHKIGGEGSDIVMRLLAASILQPGHSNIGTHALPFQ